MVRLEVPWARIGALDCVEVAHWLGLEKKRGAEKGKWACVACASSDGMELGWSAADRTGKGWYCFACGAGGDAIDLVAQHRTCSKLDAAKELADWAHITIGEATYTPRAVRYAQPAPTTAPREVAAAGDPAHDDRLALMGVWQGLEVGPRARAYLLARGFDPEVCALHGLRSVESALALERASAHGATCWPARLALPALVIPYRQDDGYIDTLRLRAMPGSQAPRRYRSLRGMQPRRPFGAWSEYDHARSLGGTLYVCEGELSALAVRHTGRAAIGFAGSKTFRPEHCAAWGAMRRVVLLVDHDVAGEAWATAVYSGCAKVHGARWAAERITVCVMPGGDAADHLLARSLEAQLESIQF